MRTFLLCALMALACASATRAADRAPAAVASEAALFVELVIDGQADGPIVPMRLEGGHPIVAAADLAAAGLKLAAGGEIDLAATPGVSARYVAADQRLLIDAAPELLPMRHIAADARTRTRSVADTGMLLNYDLYATYAGGHATAALWSEPRLFGAFGALSSSGTLRAGGGRMGYLRYDTRYRLVDEARALQLSVGDLITQSLPWTSSVRLGGIQLARTFRVRPDLLTMPLPSFAGQAAVPSAVDLFIDGFRQQSAQVAPGRFVLDNMPVVSGAGQATIVTTDAVGRQIATSIPFYVAAQLLRPGLLDGGVEAGFLRRGYGLRSFDYGAAAGSGVLRYGLSRHLTVEAHGEGSRGLALGGGGLVWSPGLWGVIDLAAAASRHGSTTAGQWSAGYSYVGRAFGIAAEHVARTPGYRDLGTFDLANYAGTRRSDRVIATAALPGHAALAAAFLAGRTLDGNRTRLVSLSYSRAIGRGASLFAGADVDLVSHAASAQLRLIVPFGRRSTIAGGASHAVRRGTTGEVNYQRSVPSDGGVGLAASIAASPGGNAYGQASALWRMRGVELQGGGAFANRRGSAWAGATGTVAMMDGAIHAASRMSDAFAIVSTDGVAGVPISYENQPIGVTDAGGHLFVPAVTAYHPGRFALDPLALAEDMAASTVETRVAVREGAGAVVRMAVRHMRSVSVALVDGGGRALGAGDVAKRAGGRHVTIGWDGLTFLEDAALREPLIVVRRDGKSCRATVAIPPNVPALATIGPVPCT